MRSSLGRRLKAALHDSGLQRSYASLCSLPDLLQDKEANIVKLQASLQDLSLKCEAASAHAEASQPYEQRYRDAQVGSPPVIAPQQPVVACNFPHQEHDQCA